MRSRRTILSRVRRCATADHTVSANNCPEIYAWGLPQPVALELRLGRPAICGLGDVGQGALEEIDRVQRGGNYGWNCREGFERVQQPGTELQRGHAGSSIPCTSTVARSVSRLPAATCTAVRRCRRSSGSYLFADYGSGRIWRLVPNGSGGFTSEELLDTSLSIASFGQGNDGELYVVDIAGGGAAQDRAGRRRADAGHAGADAAVGDGLRERRRTRASPRAA